MAQTRVIQAHDHNELTKSTMMKTQALCRQLFVPLVLISGGVGLWADVPADPALDYPAYTRGDADLAIERSAYAESLQGFWLGECIANWTGLRTEGMKKTAPFFTDDDWGTDRGRNGS